MTEQEYCDLTDLQLARQIRSIAHDLHCFDEPSKSMRAEMMRVANRIIDHLEPKIILIRNLKAKE